MAYYVVHPGDVRLQSTNQTVYIDAGTLASYYGLSGGEYDVSSSTQEGNFIHVHLYPRPDEKYKNIKTALGDNGTDTFLEKPVNWRQHQRERRKYF